MAGRQMYGWPRAIRRPWIWFWYWSPLARWRYRREWRRIEGR